MEKNKTWFTREIKGIGKVDESEKQLIHNLNVALGVLGKELDNTKKELFELRQEVDGLKAREFSRGRF